MGNVHSEELKSIFSPACGGREDTKNLRFGHSRFIGYAKIRKTQPCSAFWVRCIILYNAP